MIKFAIPIAALSLVFSTAAFSAEEVSGKIEHINTVENRIILESGHLISVDQGYLLDRLKTGDEVKVTYEVVNGRLTATDIKPAAGGQ